MSDTCSSCGREVRPEKYLYCPRCNTPLDPEHPEVLAAAQAAEAAEERREQKAQTVATRMTRISIAFGALAILGAALFVAGPVLYGFELLFLFAGLTGGALALVFR